MEIVLFFVHCCPGIAQIKELWQTCAVGEEIRTKQKILCLPLKDEPLHSAAFAFSFVGEIIFINPRE